MPVIFHWTLKTRKRLFYPLEEKHFSWPILDIKHHITQIEAPSVFQPANTVIRIILKKKDLSRKQTHCSCVLLCLICLKWEVICEKEYFTGICTITTVPAFSSLAHICSPCQNTSKQTQRLQSKHNVWRNSHRWVKKQSSCHQCLSHLTTCTSGPLARTSSKAANPLHYSTPSPGCSPLPD